MDDRTTHRLTRRHALHRATALGLGATILWLAPTRAPAQARLAKDAVKYVDQGDVPGKDCDDCRHYLAPAKPHEPASCRLVERTISPHKHCIAFTPKG